MPILQIVHETLRDIQEGNKGPRAAKPASASSTSNAVQLSVHDRSHGMAVDSDGLTCQSRDQRIWNGGRSTKGVKGKGKYFLWSFVPSGRGFGVRSILFRNDSDGS